MTAMGVVYTVGADPGVGEGLGPTPSHRTGCEVIRRTR